MNNRNADRKRPAREHGVGCSIANIVFGAGRNQILCFSYFCTVLTTNQAQCRLFDLNYNPEGIRLGNKVLRQRLRGPVLAAYYPRKTVAFRDLQDTFLPFDLETWDDFQEDREEAIQMYAIFPLLVAKALEMKEKQLLIIDIAQRCVERELRKRSALRQVRNCPFFNFSYD